MTHDEFKQTHGEESWTALVEPRTRAPFPTKLRGRACDMVHVDIIMPVLHLLGFRHATGLREVGEYVKELQKAAVEADAIPAYSHRGGDTDDPVPPVAAVVEAGRPVGNYRVTFRCSISIIDQGPDDTGVLKDIAVDVPSYTAEDAVYGGQLEMLSSYGLAGDDIQAISAVPVPENGDSAVTDG